MRLFDALTVTVDSRDFRRIERPEERENPHRLHDDWRWIPSWTSINFRKLTSWCSLLLLFHLLSFPPIPFAHNVPVSLGSSFLERFVCCSVLSYWFWPSITSSFSHLNIRTLIVYHLLLLRNLLRPYDHRTLFESFEADHCLIHLFFSFFAYLPRSLSLSFSFLQDLSYRTATTQCSV